MNAAQVEASVFCFMGDVLEDGADAFCRATAEAGLSAVTVAASYHEARDLRPRGAVHLVERPAGAHYFPPEPALYADSPIAPWAPEPFDRRDGMAELRDATERTGLALTAWTVFCRNARAAQRHPELCQRSAFDEPMGIDLCPANPGVQAWTRAVAADVLRYRPARLLAESLHFHPLRDGRRFLPLDAATRLALGLCFCTHCETAARAEGVAVAAVRAWARDTVEAAFAGGVAESADPLADGELEAVLGGELAAYLRARCGTVRGLVEQLGALAASAGSELVMMDQAGVEPPALSTERPQEALRYGVDPALLGPLIDGYEALAYGADPAAAGRTVAGYRALLPAAVAVRAALRPSWPDSTTVADLAAKVDAVIAAGAAAVDFYHCGLWATDALARTSTVVSERFGNGV